MPESGWCALCGGYHAPARLDGAGGRDDRPARGLRAVRVRPSPAVRALLADEGTGGGDGAGWNALVGIGAPVTVTYSFMARLPSSVDAYDKPGFRPFTAAERRYARLALAAWAATSGLAFIEVSDGGAGGDIRFGAHDFRGTESSQAAAYAYYPDVDPDVGAPTDTSGDVYFNTANVGDSRDLSPGHYGYFALLHEIGHALGLKHPFDGRVRLSPAEDTSDNTVMTYTIRQPYPTTPQPYDVAAVRYLYGTASGLRATSYRWDARHRHMLVQGGTLADALVGTNQPDMVSAGGGDDRLAGQGGNDRLDGGTGADRVSGGPGDDTLVGGPGNDSLNGGEGNDVATFAGVRSRYRVSDRRGGSLDGSIRIAGPDGTDTLVAVERFRFAGGPTLTLAALLNRPPALSRPLADQEAVEGAAYRHPIDPAAFTDPDADRLSLEARLAGGGALPEWLTFAGEDGVFSGTPPAGTADLVLVVTARDPFGAGASGRFRLTTPAPNRPPEVRMPLVDHSVTEGQPFRVAIPIETFYDPDGLGLRLTVAQADGRAAPPWLAVDFRTWSLVGTAPAGAPDLILRVTATDDYGAAAGDDFRLVTPAANRAPRLTRPLAGVAVPAGEVFRFTLPADSFRDPDGDALILAAGDAGTVLATDDAIPGAAALPAWLAFDAAAWTFSGSPPAGLAPLTVRVTARDPAGLSVEGLFSLSLAAPLPLPGVPTPVPAGAGAWGSLVPPT